MGKYHRNKGITSLPDLLATLVQIGLVLVGLFILPYILPLYYFIVNNYIALVERYYFPTYIYVIEHPIFLIPVGIVMLGIAWGLHYCKEQRKKIRLRAMTRLSEVMKLDWREFEEFVAEILKQKGFHTILWVWIKDGGIDVTASFEEKKFFVQCKHYGTDNITVEKIRELNGVMNGQIIPVGWIFVTTTWFTVDAISEANKYGIELWDKNYLKNFLEISNIDIKKQEDNGWVCEKCWGKLVLRTAHTGINIGWHFLWCENFPECHFTKPS